MTLTEIDSALQLCADQLIIAGNQVAYAEASGRKDVLMVCAMSMGMIMESMFLCNMALVQLHLMGHNVIESSEFCLELIALGKDFTVRMERQFKVLQPTNELLN